MPDGLRFAGSATLAGGNSLLFSPKQAFVQMPPEGLPVQLMVAGLPGDDEAQLSIAGSIDEINPREALIEADDELPGALVEALSRKAADPPHSGKAGQGEQIGDGKPQLLSVMQDMGCNRLVKAMRRFLLELGDQLFDLSTSSRYGMSGQHAHYDALNALKRGSDALVSEFAAGLRSSLEPIEKNGGSETFADLERASARNLDLVALEEMDQKLAVEKIVGAILEAHRIELECLTIRSAVLAKVEPRRARTPFHPTYIVQAFVDAFERISDDSTVMKDTLKFFGKRFAPALDDIYPALNKLFIDADIEPDLEAEVREKGSLLNPVGKRIVKSQIRGDESEHRDEGSAPAYAAQPLTGGDRGTRAPGAPAATGFESAGGPGGAAQPAAQFRSGPTPVPPPAPAAAPAETEAGRHDAMYAAVLNALNTSRGALAAAAPVPSASAGVTAAAAAHGAAAAGTDARAPGDGAQPTDAVQPGTISQQELLEALQALQNTQQEVQSLGDLPPLESLISGEGSPAAGGRIDNEGANRLGFIDNVFATLHNNFEVSADIAPSLARLRVPLARLSLQEPRFFTQPEHPAHKLLDKLSVLASADHTVNHALKSKVNAIVDGIVENYQDDIAVFETAQVELDKLLTQQGRVQNRNIERVISGLEGQEKLIRAQRRVESLLEARLDREKAPKAVLELLNDGWRAALVQLALREGEDSSAWREEVALLESLLADFDRAEKNELPPRELMEMRMRLRALGQRLNESNPGSLQHETALRRIEAVLAGVEPLAKSTYEPEQTAPRVPDAARVERLPRLRRWLQRVQDLEPGARLRYRDKQGRKRLMTLVWVSDEKDRYAFVNERGQKIAELSAVQLARQLSRGAQLPSPVDEMSVLDQSVYETLEQAQKRLSFDRNRDSLTQLINGESLLFQLDRSLRHAQSRGSEHAFMLLDIDNFALVNEVFDETSGDQVIAEFARLLGQLNDRRSLTARIEGDQFGILLTYRSTDEAREIAEKVRKDIARSSLEIGSEAVSFTVSIGVAAVARESETTDSVVEQAREALATAKNQGRNQVVVFDVDQQEVLKYKREREESRKRLDDAMSTDSLVLRAQPIVQSAVDGTEGARHHYEILLSLRGEDGKLESPQDFIMSAERFGYVNLVDRWVLRETFAWISSLMDAQKEIPELSINLSGTSVTDNEFLDYVLEQISEYGVGTSRLCFEITETGAIDNLPRAADFVRTLKNIGCKFSLDDFGTGLASHKYLKELPVDYVKIDGTFVMDVHNSTTDYAMVKSINDLAHFLGQKTVAECVENMEIVPSLREIGIDYFQGWGIGMPRELHEVSEDLAKLET